MPGDPALPRPDPGSFRDPTSRVFLTDDAAFRGLDEVGAAELREALESSTLKALINEGKVMPTEFVTSPAGLEQWAAVVSHPLLDVISYPHEWTFSMLRDAALLQLEILRRGYESDLAGKDASAYNISFIGSRPVFIDLGSFERYRKGDAWFGYRQFCQMFLYPLLIRAYLDLPHAPFFRSSIDGITPNTTRRILGTRHVWRRGVPTHVWLHARAEDRYSNTERDVGAELKSAGFNKNLILANIAGLEKTIRRLEWDAESSEWSDYGKRAHYGDDDLEAKEAFVRRAAGRRPRRLAWDVGANDGRFSRLIAAHSDRVIALDVDELVVDRLYRALRDEGNEQIVPLVLNLADPSPGVGWRGRERPGFVDRNRPDLVLALAVIHHLAISANIPIPAVLDLFADLGSDLVIEFPTRDDQMVKRLLRNKREGVHDDYNLDSFRTFLTERFSIGEEERLPSGTRYLFEVSPRD